ncbi:MAG TPA: alpha/beta hydrolase [Lacisediminihabitans sp.]|uniref:alpha/beta fold hydrolase n=1 Tax=Lacisediminihabitans sp. TaxID=2787631 RepID=UPI002ED8869A
MSRYAPYAESLGRIPVEDHEVSLLGSSTRYWVYGPQDAEVTIVIVHGYRGDHHGLEPVIAQLPGIRWISPDLPGFGASAPLTGAAHDVAGYAAWFRAFSDALGLTGTAVVLGHSFGTIVVAQALTSGLPTPALILINPISSSGLEGPNRFGTFVTVAFYRLAAKLPNRVGAWLLRRWIIVQFMSSALAKTRDRRLRRWIHEEHHRYFNGFATRDSVVEGFEASISTDVSRFAADITVPTLLVAAELDDITPVRAHYALAELMPDARLTMIPGVGHLVHYEVPQLAAEAIEGFLVERGLLHGTAGESQNR